MNPGEVYWDTEIKGLHLRVFPTKKAYYLYYKNLEGVQRRPKLGDANVLTLSQARKIAKEWLAKVTLGEDPSADRRGHRAEPTLNEVLFRAMIEHWGKEKFKISGWSTEVARLYDRNIRKEFGHLKLRSITSYDIRSWHEKFHSKPYEGNRSLKVLSKLFRFAQSKNWFPSMNNPCSSIPLHEERKRKRFASADEIRKIGEILKRDEAIYPGAVAFIYTLMFTGSRPRALERATWKDLEILESDGKIFGVLNIRGKTGDETVVLPPQAMAIVEKMPGYLDNLERKIFKTKMPVDYWKKVRTEAGCPDLWLRDWRRTFATLGLSNGYSMPMLSELLNHKSAQTTMIYAKLVDQVKLTTALSIASEMEKLLARHPN